jgi:hypothetical protein
MKFPEFPSKEYKDLKDKNKDIPLKIELGEVILSTYGREEAIKLLEKYKESLTK